MKRAEQIRGFTLLEALTTLAIIVLLIGLLLPAISKIQTMARTVKQKAQFHAIELALEAFRTDSGTNDYPPSSFTQLTGAPSSGDSGSYAGAQKMAEALVGMDGFGFHSQSQWRSDRLIDTNGDFSGDVAIYFGRSSSPTLESQTQAVKDDNLKSRKGPYLEMEKANAVMVSSLYTTLASNTNVNRDTYILADVFQTVKNDTTKKKTGMPILYFRADTSKKLLYSGLGSLVPYESIYNLENNFLAFISPRPPWDMTRYHPMYLDSLIFYRRIRNPNFPGTSAMDFTDARPYRADSFILLSAGPDGFYGTPDDVYNFDESEK